jgi:hypothetical protein
VTGSAERWCAAVAAALDEAAGEVGRLAARLAAGWPDEHGREWTERALRLRRSLDREADAAAELGRAVARIADVLAGGAPPLGLRAPPGPRLGGTEARRAEDDRGVRIARLDEDLGPG